jgi:hypothetical protein
MPVYPCPECGAQLRPANPVPAGKKLRCPKCETVFAPAGKVKTKAAAPPVVQAASEDAESYAVVKQEDNKNEDATRAAFDPIKDRFKLSARGPALALIVKPSTWLLRVGVTTCLMSLVGVMFAIWPMIFKVEDIAPPDKNARFRGPDATGRKFIELTPEKYQEQWIKLAVSVFQFCWGSVICAGASKMHELKAYPLAMIASIMSLVGPMLPLGIITLMFALANEETYLILPGTLFIGGSIPFSIWCAVTLRNKKVLAGFAEEEPDDL